MRLLLDTHALIWWLADSRRLPTRVRHAIFNPENEKLVSAATAWEITTKHRLGKLPEADILALDVTGALRRQGFTELPITVDEGARAGSLPSIHRDPFDRMLVAQALSRNLVLISVDPIFDQYGVQRFW